MREQSLSSLRTSSGNGRYRAWCLTDFTRTLIQRARDTEDDRLTFFVGQGERASSTSTAHHQAYAEFSCALRLGQVKNLFGIASLHGERRRGTAKQAADYCRKDDTYDESVGERFERGRPHDGRGTSTELSGSRHGGLGERLRAAFLLLSSGGTGLELFDSDPAVWSRYYSVLQSLQLEQQLSRPCIRRLRVRTYVGAPGAGKTSRAYCDDPQLYRLSPPSSTGGPVWWDGYRGQSTVLIDDFDGWIPYRTFLQITDVYPLTLPVKGSFVYANYSLIIITSNFPPDQWFVGNDPTPVTRRIHELITL